MNAIIGDPPDAVLLSTWCTNEEQIVHARMVQSIPALANRAGVDLSEHSLTQTSVILALLVSSRLGAAAGVRWGVLR